MVPQKTATAVAHCKRGHGLIKVNGRPLEYIEPRTLQFKLMEPVLLLGKVGGGGCLRNTSLRVVDLSLGRPLTVLGTETFEACYVRGA